MASQTNARSLEGQNLSIPSTKLGLILTFSVTMALGYKNDYHSQVDHLVAGSDTDSNHGSNGHLKLDGEVEFRDEDEPYIDITVHLTPEELNRRSKWWYKASVFLMGLC
ncbi:unnamed protein product [Wickerhamomyces anomalus]